MTRLTMMLFVLTLLCGSNISQAQETEEAELTLEEQMSKIAKLEAGVHSIQKDKKGHITSCIVVGHARISTALGKSKGMELAKNKANLDCSAQFVKWLKEEITISESSDDESIILMEGEEGGDEESLKESGKSIEKSNKRIESMSKGLVRGLQMLHKEVDGDGKTYTVVKGYKADTAEGAKKIAADLASDEPAITGKKDGKAASSKEGKESKKIDKEIESGSTTSDDAADFLPKKKK